MSPGPGRRAFVVGALAVIASPHSARAAETPLRLDRSSPRVSLEAGRSIVTVEIPNDVFASIVVLGAPQALLGFDLVGSPAARIARSAGPLDEDGYLPHVVSFAPRDEPEEMRVTVDVVDPVDVALVFASSDSAHPPDPKRVVDGTELARPLVGIPAPRSVRDGYMLQVPARYLFARIDVAMALMAAFDKTYRTFKRDPIALSDISQWDGRRPKSDRSLPRHISHVGGADVDIALPAFDTFPSTTRDHCRGVLIDPDHFGCAPGSGKGVDLERLAFLLGALVDESPTPLVKVFIDDVYRREVIRIAPDLKKAGLLKEDAVAALSEDGIVVASPWHTDHVHVRFRGEQGRPPLAPTGAAIPK